MKLADISHGPDLVVWVIFAIFLIISIVLLSGHGAGLVAGYNSSSPKEQEKYDKKKMCRTVGAGMMVITVLIFVMGMFEDVLPSYTAYIAIGIITLDCLLIIILGNTVCKK